MKHALNEMFRKHGSNWRVVDTTADIYTLRNGKGEEFTTHNPILDGFTKREPKFNKTEKT